jgi:cell wall-associated NlpC family hydrolase
LRFRTILPAAAVLFALVAAAPVYAQPALTGGTSAAETPGPTSATAPASTKEAPPTGGAAPEAAGAPTGAGSTIGLTVPGSRARIRNGIAYAPELAPVQVKQALWAGNQIVGRPYVWGGGHAAFVSRGYDCSGTVSFALHGAVLLRSPMDSSEFMSFGEPGAGQWITIYTNPGHMYAVIAGVRLDTSTQGDPSNLKGPRWRPALRSHHSFQVRHPPGL